MNNVISTTHQAINWPEAFFSVSIFVCITAIVIALIIRGMD